MGPEQGSQEHPPDPAYSCSLQRNPETQKRYGQKMLKARHPQKIKKRSTTRVRYSCSPSHAKPWLLPPPDNSTHGTVPQYCSCNYATLLYSWQGPIHACWQVGAVAELYRLIEPVLLAMVPRSLEEKWSARVRATRSLGQFSWNCEVVRFEVLQVGREYLDPRSM